MDNTPDTRALEHQLALVKKDMEIMKADLSAQRWKDFERTRRSARSRPCNARRRTSAG
ncbi:MAG: hypothetical protein OXC72_08565 [Roseovarius sp.]|nr:hypothetical protein [Roseovarius sp.]